MFFWRRRRIAVMEKEEIFGEGKYIFCEEKQGRKKWQIFGNVRYISCRGEENRERRPFARG